MRLAHVDLPDCLRSKESQKASCGNPESDQSKHALKNGAGSFNVVKPRYSSFKMGGVHLRGKKAANLQMIYMAVTSAVFLAVLAFRIAVALAWLLVMTALFLWDVVMGFIWEVRKSENDLDS